MPCPTCEPIPGFLYSGCHLYRVWSDGRVETRHSRWGLGKWRPLKPAPAGSGRHLKVTLCAPGKREQRSVHHLVLEAFVGPCPEGLEALHGDGNPTNNDVGNLRWGTRQENVDDMMRHGTHFTPFAKPPALSPEKIAEMQRRGDAGESTRKLAKEFGVGKSTAHLIIARKGVYAEKTHGV